MASSKLLTSIMNFFDESKKKQHNKQEYLQQVLKKLKAKQKELRKKLKDENGKGKSKEIQKEIDIVHAQRTKGLKLLKRLKKG